MPLQVVPLDLESLPFVASTYIADLPSSPLTRLRYGSCESSALSKHIYQDFHTRIKTSKHDGRTSFTKVIDPDIGEDIAWAQWVIPNDKQLDPPPTPVQPDAQKAIPDTQAPAKPETQGLKGENLAVVADWSAKGRVAWQRSVGRRKHWILGNIVTHPVHRRKGAATLLLEEVLSQADQNCVPVFLQTARDGYARQLYEKVGFKKTEEYIIDLQQCGGKEVDGWGYISMVREPKLMQPAREQLYDADSGQR